MIRYPQVYNQSIHAVKNENKIQEYIWKRNIYWIVEITKIEDTLHSTPLNMGVSYSYTFWTLGKRIIMNLSSLQNVSPPQKIKFLLSPIGGGCLFPQKEG